MQEYVSQGPSDVEHRRFEQIDIKANLEDDSVTVTDRAIAPFKPTEEQLLFLERKFWDWEYSYSTQKALDSVGCTKHAWKKWMRDPGFIALYQEEKEQRGVLIVENAKELVVRALESDYNPARDKKWAAEIVLRNDLEDRKMNIRFVQINQFNLGPQADHDDDALLRVINAGNEIAAKTITQVIEGR